MPKSIVNTIGSFILTFPERNRNGECELVGKDEYITVDPDRLCSVMTKNLETELVQQSGNYAWIAVLCARVRAEYEYVKDTLGVTAAETDKTVRFNHEDDNRKITEKAVAAEVMSTDEYKAAMSNVLLWQKNVEMVAAIKDALVHKRDMLVQLAAMRRVELQQTTE